MSTESTVSPLLAVAAIGMVFALLFLILAAEVNRAGWLREAIVGHGQKAMFVVAGSAMAASLYYSEVVGFVPCEFCWSQRIAMYPLAVLLGVSVVSRQRFPSRYLLALAGIGLALSLYHYQLQLFPEQGSTCSQGVSCAGRYVNEFGFVTIPFMAGCSFLSVLLVELAQRRAAFMRRAWGESADESVAPGVGAALAAR